MILIGKINQPVPQEFTKVRCDRKSVLGNPYSAKQYGHDKACDLYHDYFMKQLKTNEEFKFAVHNIAAMHERGEHVMLLCWCYPKRCHTMTIRDYCLNLVMQYRSKQRTR